MLVFGEFMLLPWLLLGVKLLEISLSVFNGICEGLIVMENIKETRWHLMMAVWFSMV